MYWSWQRRRRNVDWKRSSTSCCQTSRVDSASTCRTCCMDRRANDRRGSLRIYSSFLIRLNTLMTQTRPSLLWHDDCCVADLPCLRWFDVVGYVGRNIQACYRHSNCVCGEHFWGLETPKCVCWDDENISIGFCCDVVYDRKVSSWDVKTVCSGLFMTEKCRAEMWRPSAVDCLWQKSVELRCEDRLQWTLQDVSMTESLLTYLWICETLVCQVGCHSLLSDDDDDDDDDDETLLRRQFQMQLHLVAAFALECFTSLAIYCYSHFRYYCDIADEDY